MVDLELLNWIADSPYRLAILKILHNKPNIPKNISKEIGIHKSSLSRILKGLYKQKLVEKVTSSSRTITYKITELGDQCFRAVTNKE